MKKYFLLATSGLLTLASYNQSNKLDNSDVTDLIADYLEEGPLHETGKLNTNKQKLSNSSDQELIEAIQRLIDEGSIEVDDEKVCKKWFSKDSVHIITPALTKEVLSYLVKQDKNNTEVETTIYKFDDKKVTLGKSTENVSVCTVILDKEKMPFYYFGKDPYPNASFITQKFKLKYNEKTGRRIIKK